MSHDLCIAFHPWPGVRLGRDSQLRGCALGGTPAQSCVPAAASAPAWRNVDAVDGLDERMLRDIGVESWQAHREARTARDATQWRIDSGFG